MSDEHKCPECDGPLQRNEDPHGITFQCFAPDCLSTFDRDEIEVPVILHRQSGGQTAEALIKPTAVIPVIHYETDNQAMRNAERAFEAGCPGVMLIEMRGRDHHPYWVATAIKRRWPDRLVGINFLNAERVKEMPIYTAPGLDMTWTDQQLTFSQRPPEKAKEALAALSTRPGHLFFCGVAFKYMEPEPYPAIAARAAAAYGLIPTTSGPATGKHADPAVIEVMREALGPHRPLAIASGITPENAHRYCHLVSHILVSTGVSSSFHEFDPARLRALVDAVA